MLEIIKSNINTLENIKNESQNLIYEGQPIPYFGNLSTAKIATLGLNPSDKEFYCDNHNELEKHSRRFETLSSLNLNNWASAKKNNLDSIKKCMDQYFKNNPYKRWFNQLDNLFNESGYSYYNNTACHIDLIPYATRNKWSSLKGNEQNFLINASQEELKNCIENSEISTLILNGSSVIQGLLKSYDITLKKEEVKDWQIQTKKGVISGFKFTGKLRINSERDISILGFNYNLQSSFGLSKNIKNSIKAWISSELEKNRMCNEPLRKN